MRRSPLAALAALCGLGAAKPPRARPRPAAPRSDPPPGPYRQAFPAAPRSDPPPAGGEDEPPSTKRFGGGDGAPPGAAADALARTVSIEGPAAEEHDRLVAWCLGAAR